MRPVVRHNNVKTFWPRVVYFSVGAIFTPISLGLSIMLLRAPVEGASPAVLYLLSAFFGLIAVITASAFRAAFRNPPWWIISPEQTRKSTALLIRRQIITLAKKRVKLARKSLKVAEDTLKYSEQLQKMERAEPGSPPNGRPAVHPSNSEASGGPQSVI